jgi:hypothetical protein
MAFAENNYHSINRHAPNLALSTHHQASRLLSEFNPLPYLLRQR